MTAARNEELRLDWASSVATANQAVDLLEEARRADEPDPNYLAECEHQLVQAQEAVDAAYKAYIEATKSWVTDAPWRPDVIVVPSFIDATTEIRPALTFGFRGGPADEPITVTLIATEMEIRDFQKRLDKACNEAIVTARKMSNERRAKK